MPQLSRRRFVQQALAVPSRGSTLVCVFLRGGADTLSILVPYGDDDYYRLRPTLAIAPPAGFAESRDRCIRLDELHGLHPQMRPLLPAYEEGRLAFIQAVGSDNPSGSHFEAQDQMERGEAFGQSIGSGWLGRYLYGHHGSRAAPLSAVALQPVLPESLRGAPSASAMETLDDLQLGVPEREAGAYARALGALYQAQGGLLQQAGQSTLDLLDRVRSLRADGYRPEQSAEYPEGNFGTRLREVARLIKADVGLEAACVDLGGWDTHFFQGAAEGQQSRLIADLALGLAAFDADLARHRDSVTVLVMTEFGRRVYENASLGTDHGRGFTMMALGKEVRGGRIIGGWPGLDEDDTYEAGPGGLPILIDYRSVLAEVLERVSGRPRLDGVFPDFTPQAVGLF